MSALLFALRRLRADKVIWKTGEAPAFRLEVRNQAKRDFPAIKY